ncbi:FAD-dependent monooxygenase [bacterium]|nr:FAD-dependent monooxygenase [bacterium]
MNENKVDVIIVGAGPAGTAAGITLARANKKVVIVERGSFAGSKNMFGGAIYDFPTCDLYPKFREEAPIERINKEHRYIINDSKSSVSLSYKKNDTENSYTVIRSKWDNWCIEQAVALGAYFSPKTTVRELIQKDGKVIGIKTDEEEFFADIVILADGVNSLLAKQIGLRKDIKDSQVAIGVKEVIKLPKEIIEQRFNLGENDGCITQIIGYPAKGFTGLGFMYTNKESITIGLGINLDELGKNKVTPNELLNNLKNHPNIYPLIKDGELIEYSAHLIPEGGFKAIPKLYGDGVMVVGDAAMLVNNVHFEGTNIAMLSGKLAAETAIEAIDSQIFSKEILSEYEEKLKNTSFYKDLKTYKDIIHIVHENSSQFLGYYPEKINQFFEMFTQTGYIPKKSLFRKYIKQFIKGRSFSRLFKDIGLFIKMFLGILK